MCMLFVISAFLNIPPAQFKLVLDSIIWAFKHTMRNVADTGLDILYQLLQNVGQTEEAAQSFYQTYFKDILQHVFSVVTDSSHTAGKVIIEMFMESINPYYICSANPEKWGQTCVCALDHSSNMKAIFSGHFSEIKVLLLDSVNACIAVNL